MHTRVDSVRTISNKMHALSCEKKTVAGKFRIMFESSKKQAVINIDKKISNLRRIRKEVLAEPYNFENIVKACDQLESMANDQ